jgi:hypothetical protein
MILPRCVGMPLAWQGLPSHPQFACGFLSSNYQHSRTLLNPIA